MRSTAGTRRSTARICGTAPERARGQAAGAGSPGRRVQPAHRREWRLNQIGRQHRQSVEAHFSKTWFDLRLGLYNVAKGWAEAP
jgi:hypothetical protein